MFNRTPKNDTHPLDETITLTISQFEGTVPGSEEQHRIAETIKTLMELRTADKATKSYSLSPDMIASIAANLLGIGLILGFEKAGIVTSKSLNFVQKIKT